ncbi:hypothetical protein LK542_04485 [Massilia sp. IC2-477]|uniref:type II secretion system protein n=1 Tax=Massilia sp. IC2-477 TaxID=2887198 RepID=UPI001D11A3B8|nr:hypothetical protein [Massilia sp. IC2-477]MCC2954871.1 hypothetical protein [Massilia sp. IC2-477]
MRAPAAGLSYIEVMVALVLLAICAVPAAEAIRSGLRAAAAGTEHARELRCVKSRMEVVLAESFEDLWKEVKGKNDPSSYSLPADAGPDGECGVRNVYISKYVHPYGAAVGTVLEPNDEAENTLLMVTVSGTDGMYPLTTLVDR